MEVTARNVAEAEVRNPAIRADMSGGLRRRLAGAMEAVKLDGRHAAGLGGPALLEVANARGAQPDALGDLRQRPAKLLEIPDSVCPSRVHGSSSGIPFSMSTVFRSACRMEFRTMKTIGERVREAREDAGLTIKELAADVGMAKSTLGDLEQGASKSTTKLHRIATRLNVRVEWLETGRGVKAVAATPKEESQDSTARLATGLSTTAAHDVRPDFGRMAAATRLLAKYLDNTPFDKALLFDPEMLAMAWDGVELVGDSVEPSNVLDFMAYMSRRMEERSGAIRPGEDRSARQAIG